MRARWKRTNAGRSEYKGGRCARERARGWESRGVRPRSESRSSSFVSTRAGGGGCPRGGWISRAPRERGKKPTRDARGEPNRTEPNRLTRRRARAGGSREDDTILFDDGARSKVQTVAREIYDESPAMQNAQMCLSWRPQTKKKEDPAGFVAELTNHIKSQKETLKQLLQHLSLIHI